MYRLFQVLACRSRVRILMLLERGVSRVSEISRGLGLARSTVIKHLRIMEAQGLVERYGKGEYRLREGVAEKLYLTAMILKEGAMLPTGGELGWVFSLAGKALEYQGLHREIDKQAYEEQRQKLNQIWKKLRWMADKNARETG